MQACDVLFINDEIIHFSLDLMNKKFIFAKI